MEIKIEKNPNFLQIPFAYKQILKLNIDAQKLLNSHFINSLNPKQFIFLMGVISFEGKNFEYNFEFIKQYILKLDQKKENLLLEIEGHLYQYFLKRYETEESYQKFCSFFDDLYKIKIHKTYSSLTKSRIKNVLFFLHSPVFLAHTNPLLYMLKERQNTNIKITVVSLAEDKIFTNYLSKINVNFVLLKGSNIFEQLNFFIKISQDYSKIVWQSVPLYLGYVSKKVNNIFLWSFKFHPRFCNVSKSISSFLSYNEIVNYNGHDWINIDVGFDIKNLGQDILNWNERKLKFGAFCRDELIDSEDYWLIVKSILSTVKNSTFYYCGRRKIDAHWCAKLQISSTKIVYLGWLEEPHLKLKEMSFLLDGFKLGHGYLAYEAMAAGIPIIFPQDRKSYGTMEMYTKKLSTHPKHKHALKNYKKYFLCFKNNEEVNDISHKLMTNKKFNRFYGDFNRELISLYPKDTFESFCKALLN